MQLNHRELAAFLSILRHGSINAAAQSLGITQPALSRALKRLEDRLGVSLFIRHSQGMEPTPYGEVLKTYAEQLEFETDRIVEEIRMMAGAATGLVRVAMVPSVASNLLPPALKRALDVSPGIQIRVLVGTGGQMLSAVTRGEVDFAIVGQPQEPIDGTVLVTPLCEEEVCIAARAGHPLFDQPEMTIQDLLRYAWILPDKGNVNRHHYRALFQREGLDPPWETMTCNSAGALKSVLLSGDYLTILTRPLIWLEERQGLIRPLPLRDATWRRSLAVVQRQGSTLLPTARLLIRELTASAAELEAA